MPYRLVPQVINQYDKEFQEHPDEIIFQTILAANFLDIKNLLELMCKKVADEIKKCKTPDDIRDRFNIRQDYTPEEVEEVKKAHPWIYGTCRSMSLTPFHHPRTSWRTVDC